MHLNSAKRRLIDTMLSYDIDLEHSFRKMYRPKYTTYSFGDMGHRKFF